MSDATGSFAPATSCFLTVSLLTTTSMAWDKLKQNNWFKKAIKVAIAIGEDANKTVLADFTGNVESVITVHSPEALKKWIQFVSVRASEIGSKSSNAGTGDAAPSGEGSEIVSKQDEFVREIQAQAADAAEWDSFDDDGIQW